MLYVHPNSCPYYAHLAWKCRKLKRSGLIFSTWQTQTGTVVLKLSEGSRYQKIYHEDDLDVLFPGFEYEDIRYEPVNVVEEPANVVEDENDVSPEGNEEEVDEGKEDEDEAEDENEVDGNHESNT